jgi:integrase
MPFFRLPPTVIQSGRIKLRTRKRGVWIDIPIMPELKDALAEAKRNTAGKDHEAITLCTNSRGKPWTLSGFSCSFRKALKDLQRKGLIGDGLTFHGLRHTVATVLAEAALSAEDIAAVLGQRTSQMADHYSREADRSRRTTAAIKKFRPLETTKGGDDKERKVSEYV